MRNGDARPTKLSVEGATKYYQTKTGLVHALEDYTMQVKEGELVCVLGPSGCGQVHAQGPPACGEHSPPNGRTPSMSLPLHC